MADGTDGTPDGTPDKAHKGRGRWEAAVPPPDFANAEEEAEWRRRKHEERTGVHLMTKEEAGIREDLPRGTVSGYAAEQMTEEDEDEHEPGGRADGAPRSMPPPRPRGQPAAAVPAVCGGVDGVYLARRAMFRCMCGPDLEDCAAKSGEGDGVVLTTTAFERHCGMEKSKNWRNSCSVMCARGQKVKIGIWLDEVGIDVARGGGGGGGGPGSRAPPKDHKAPKEPKGPIKDTRWQPRRPGPFDNLPPAPRHDRAGARHGHRGGQSGRRTTGNRASGHRVQGLAVRRAGCRQRSRRERGGARRLSERRERRRRGRPGRGRLGRRRTPRRRRTGDRAMDRRGFPSGAPRRARWTTSRSSTPARRRWTVA